MPDLVLLLVGLVLIGAGLLVRAIRYAPTCTCGDEECGGGCILPSRRKRP